MTWVRTSEGRQPREVGKGESVPCDAMKFGRLHYGIVFFFFQAEDGIRDLTVTGVQTCALPISHCERDEFASTERSWTSVPTRPASACRHRAGARDPLFEHPNAVPQLRGKLEVFAFDGAPQLRLEIQQMTPRIRIEIGRASCRERV